MNYKQCTLQKGNTRQISWIPEKFSVVGKFLKLREPGGWQDGWEVVFVGQALTQKQLQVVKVQHRHTRDVSDV